MTREELHELVDIVMDARDRGNNNFQMDLSNFISIWHFFNSKYWFIKSDDYPTFSDFTQAVKDYIKSLEG